MRRWRVDGLVQNNLLCFQTADLRGFHLGPLERIVLEETFFDTTVRELHAAGTILDSSHPFSFVARAILPVHLSIAVTLIVPVATLVEIAALPSKHAHTVLLVVFVGTFVHVAILVVESLLPLSLPMLQTILELSDVDASIFPFVLTLTFRFAKVIRAREAVAIGEDIRALAVLQTVLPFALESISVLPLVNSVASRFRLAPLPDVRVTEDTFPDALALFKPESPFSFVDFSIGPCVDAFAVGFPVQELSFVSVAV